MVKESQASIMAASTITWNSDNANDRTGTFYKLGSDYVTTYNGNTYPIYSSNSNPGSDARIILKTSDGYDLKMNGLGAAPSSYLKNVSAANSTYSYLVTNEYFDTAHGTGSVSTTEGKIQSEDFNALSLSEGTWMYNSTPMNVTVTDPEAVTSCTLVDITQYYTKTEVDSAITSATNGKQDAITSSSMLSYDLLSGTPDLSSFGKDSLQITVPSVTQSVKFVLETSATGASSSWTTQISYSQAVQLEFMNPSSGNLTTNPSNSISTNYSGMTMIVKQSQMGNPDAGTYYRYQFITGTSTSAENWILGIFGSSSNGDFKTIQTRLSTLEGSTPSSSDVTALSTRMSTAESNITTLSSSISSKPSLGSTAPANLAATANAGSSSAAARADHVHSTSGLVTIDSSSLSSVISVAIVSGSLPSTVSDNVLYFVLGSGESESVGPHLEISTAPTSGNWQNSIGSYTLTAGTATSSDAVWTKTDNSNFYIIYDSSESNTWVLFDTTSNNYTYYRLCSAYASTNATSVFASATSYNGFTTQYVAE